MRREERGDLCVVHIKERWVFVPRGALGLSLCLPVCYCIGATLAAATLNNASLLANSLLAPRQSRGRLESGNNEPSFFLQQI